MEGRRRFVALLFDTLCLLDPAIDFSGIVFVFVMVGEIGGEGGSAVMVVLEKMGKVDGIVASKYMCFDLI